MIAALARRLPIFYGWVIVAIAFLTMAIAVNARTAFSLFYPPVLAEFGWDRGSTAGPWVTGLLHDHTGSYIPGFLVAGACSIASALAIWIAAPRKIRRVGLV